METLSLTKAHSSELAPRDVLNSGCERKQTHLFKSRLEKRRNVSSSLLLNGTTAQPQQTRTSEVEKEATAFQPHKRVFLWMKNSDVGQNKDKINCVYFHLKVKQSFTHKAPLMVGSSRKLFSQLKNKPRLYALN